MEVLQSPIRIRIDGIVVSNEFANNLVNSSEQNMKKNQTCLNLIENALSMHNIFALPQLPIRQTRGNEPLVDHSRFHVVTFDEYLIILRKRHWTRHW